VCADGGNPIHAHQGQEREKAKEVELQGWPYPKHLAGRVYGLIVHGDVAGVEDARRALSDWLDWIGFIDAGFKARLDRYIGYYDRMRRATKRSIATPRPGGGAQCGPRGGERRA
jgi:hypothetical protein